MITINLFIGCLLLTYLFISTILFHLSLSITLWLLISQNLNSFLNKFKYKCTSTKIYLFYLTKLTQNLLPCKNPHHQSTHPAAPPSKPSILISAVPPFEYAIAKSQSARKCIVNVTWQVVHVMRIVNASDAKMTKRV